MGSLLKVTVIIILLTCITTFPRMIAGKDLPKGVYSIKLESNNIHHYLYWTYNWKEKYTTIQLHANITKNQWFALGFSSRGEFTDADFCIFHKTRNRNYVLTDIWTDDKCLAKSDRSQDCRNLRYQDFGSYIRILFTRKLDTCDNMDYHIEEGTTHILWGTGDGFPKDGISMCNLKQSGMTRTTFLRVENEPDINRETWVFSATVPTFNVPSSHTTYWCHITRMPQILEKNKHHIIRFEPVIKEKNLGVVHHMELFHCEISPHLELPKYSGLCEEKPKELEICKKVISAWAMGASPFNYPQKVGLPIGGKGFSSYAMLEIHYHNPEMRSDWVDSSGLRIYLTPNLRPLDAGVIELGLEYTDKMAIPPKQKSFVLEGYCLTECTAAAIPLGGIWIFASQLHTHLTGVKVETIIVKHNEVRAKVDWDNHYSPHYQEIRPLRNNVYVQPGDALITRCTYNTMDRDNVTLGGFATTDEMCVNYIYYYPKIKLEVCKSSISDADLAKYFNDLHKLENQKTSSHSPISTSYKNIKWTPIRVKVLDELYHRSRLYMQCNQSDGNRFPGVWERMPQTVITKNLRESVSCRRRN